MLLVGFAGIARGRAPPLAQGGCDATEGRQLNLTN
jgi:hypothetical protein